MDEAKKAAFVAVVGRPSAGKSTLVNLLCGAKVAIVSPVPQTTRNAIRGIVNGERGQLVLVDTPGIHISEKKLNRKLLETAGRSAAESDLVLYLLDASRPPGLEEAAVADSLLPYTERLITAINKTDHPGADLTKAQGFLQTRFPGLPDDRRFQISALNNQGVPKLLDRLFDLAPPEEALYPEEYYTDQDLGFRIGEIIRGEAINRLRQELPHALYVEVADTELRDAPGGKQRLWVRAFIITERESQKGMIVGKGGEMIKAIGEAARKELNRILDWKVELDLRVKTGKDWRHNDRILRKLTDRS
ncbi:GTPase Era [Spirochaetia bacterium]|nr:GTPase Era [Spirochaetia bacterium]